MDRRENTRRQFLRTGGLLGVVGATGCLRLTEDTADNSTSGAGETNLTDGRPTTTSAVELTTHEQFTDTTVYDPVSHAGAFYGRSEEGPTRIRLDGEIAWSAPNSTVPGGYYFADGVSFSSTTVFFGLGAHETPEEPPKGGTVVALDKATGETLWEFTVEDDGMHHTIPSIAFVSADLLAVGAADTGSGDVQEPLVYGLDPATGEQRWRTGDFPADHITKLFEYNGSLYVVMMNGIYRCRPETGAVTRIRDLHSGLGTPLVGDDTVYLPGQSFQAFDLDSERVRWETQINGHIYTQPVIQGDLAFVGTRTGYVYAFDTSDASKQWDGRTISQAEDMAVTSNHVWVADDVGTLYAFSQQDGEKVYEERQDRRNQRDVAALDDRLLMTHPARLAEVV